MNIYIYIYYSLTAMAAME